MTSPIPAIQVLLDDGSGTYSYDITSRVSLSAGVTLSGYGRTDEFATVNAASLSLSLKNDDGALSVGAGFGVLPFGFGGFGGSGGVLFPDMGIRFKETIGATTSTRFTGRISEMALGSVGFASSVVDVTCVDLLADLGVTLRSMLEQEILLRSPSAYYTLTEAEGATSAGDTSGNQAPVSTPSGTGTAVAFGAGTGPGTDGLSAAQFTGAGQTLSAPVVLTGAMSVGAWLVAPASSNAAPVMGFTADGSVAFSLNLEPAAWTGTTGTIAGSSLDDGHTHFLMATFDGTMATLYVDAVSVGAVASTVAPVSTIQMGTTGGDVMTLSHVAFFPTALSAADVSAIYAAGHTGFTGETTDDRFARILAYTGLAGSTTTGMSGQTMSAQATSGKSALDALQEVATAEGGVLYADGDGTIVLQGRGYRASKVAADVTVPAKDIDPGTQVTWDKQQKVGQVTVSRTDGATQVVGAGLPTTTLDLAVDNDGDALRAAQWLAFKHADPDPRLGQATINLLTSSSAAAIIGADIGDRLALSGMPSQNWEGVGDLTIEGYSETLQVSSSGAAWSLTANLLPWSLSTALILDDPVYGALDSYPIMN